MKKRKIYFHDDLKRFCKDYVLRIKAVDKPYWSHCLAYSLALKAMDYYYSDDIKAFKNECCIISKLYLISKDTFNFDTKFLYPLLSDNQEVIKDFSLHEPTNHYPRHGWIAPEDYPPFSIGKLNPKFGDNRFEVYALQCVIKDDWNEFYKIKELAEKNLKDVKPPYTLFRFTFKFYDLLYSRNEGKIVDYINWLLTSEIRKQITSARVQQFYLFASHYPTLFTKLCWMKGLEIEIKHKKVPMNLMPIEPLEEYDLIYDFLKPDYDWEAGAKKAREELEKMGKTIP